MKMLFFFKPIVDMLYQYQFLDILLMLICICCFFSPNYKINYKKIDYVVLILSFLFFLSFIRNINGWSQFLKIESSFLLFFLGRFYRMGTHKLIRCLQKGFIPVIIVSVIAYITGLGFEYWGNYNTFRGFYFFKTDLALAMTQCFIVFSFIQSKSIILKLIPLICLFFVVISNARIYYLILLIVLLLSILYYYEIKTNRIIVKLNTKFFLFVFVLVIFIILLMIHLNGILDNSFLLLDMSDGLYSDANTQGRTVVWAEILKIFSDSDFINKLFGIDLCSDISPSLGHNSHNCYLKVLFSIGYIGSILFLLYLTFVFKEIAKIRNRFYFYVTLSFYITYLFGGLSYISIESTQGTWITMFMIGNVITRNEKEHLSYKRASILLNK